MQLAELVRLLRLDLGDGQAHQFSDLELGRCVEKGLFPLGRDLGVSYRMVDDQVEPQMSGETRELLLLLGQINACQRMRAQTANTFSFSSGDKSVDKTKQAEHWAKLEKDLTAAYQKRLQALNPSGGDGDSGSVLLTPTLLRPVIYEQGSRDVN